MDTTNNEGNRLKKMFSWVEPQLNNGEQNSTNFEDGGTTWSRQQNAVSVRHAFKSYGGKSKRNQVLSNLNMTVAKGTIYGLLGASGCGKTTLLSCIVGRHLPSETRLVKNLRYVLKVSVL
uniref:CSON007168 protein n=1 Tax=Culicoides sonorensis TaxID=179676 RepID=A0A336JYC8_CULSO